MARRWAADGPRSFAVWVLSSPACRLLCRAADHVSTHDNPHWLIHYPPPAPPTRPPIPPPAYSLSSGLVAGWWPDFHPHRQWNAARSDLLTSTIFCATLPDCIFYFFGLNWIESIHLILLFCFWNFWSGRFMAGDWNDIGALWWSLLLWKWGRQRHPAATVSASRFVARRNVSQRDATQTHKKKGKWWWRQKRRRRLTTGRERRRLRRWRVAPRRGHHKQLTPDAKIPVALIPSSRLSFAYMLIPPFEISLLFLILTFRRLICILVNSSCSWLGHSNNFLFVIRSGFLSLCFVVVDVVWYCSC